MSNSSEPTNLPRRSEAQRIGDLGQALVESTIGNAGNWIRRHVGADFGVDLEAELTHDGNVTGAVVKIQVKTASSIGIRGEEVCVSIQTSLLNYAEAMRIPLLLVVVDLATRQCWYVWLQKVVFELRESNTFPSSQSTFTIRIPTADTLTRGLSDDIPRIARLDTEVQLTLSLIELVRSSTALGRTDVVAPLSALLKSLSSTYSVLHVAKLIRDLIDAGDPPWMSDAGRAKMDLLFALARDVGESFTAEHVVGLVLREDSYSRTGLNVLGILYSYQWKYAAGLNLAPIFAERGFPEISYYCKLRERYPVQLSASLLETGIDTCIDGYELRPDHFDANRWANRGESVILDCVTPVQG